MAVSLRRYVFTCPCGKSCTEWMAETPEIARENFAVFAKVNVEARCRGCGRQLGEFQDLKLN